MLAFTRVQLGGVEVGEAGHRLDPLGAGAQCMVVTRTGSRSGTRGAQQMGLQGGDPAPLAGSAGAVVAVGTRGEQQMGL